jgi:arylsulfatase A-like enzyme
MTNQYKPVRRTAARLVACGLIAGLLPGFLTGVANLHAQEEPAATVQRKKPNIIFILADDMGWGDLQVYGHPYMKTPNLNRLAAEGTRFTQFYVNATVCSPTRAAFMTGHFPARHRVHAAFMGLDEKRDMPRWLDPDVTTVTDLVKSAGYVTGHFGKWHLAGVGNKNAPGPGAYGIDDHRTFGTNGPDWNGRQKDPYFRAKSTDLIVDEAIRFIQANKDNSFYLNLWTLLPHTELKPTPEQLEVYKDLQPDKNDFDSWMRIYLGKAEKDENMDQQMKIYCASVTGLDKAIGRLLAALDELGLTNDTFVFFTSDNGPEDMGRKYGFYGAVGSPGPFRGRKRSMYEGGIRMPAIARWPGNIPAGRLDSTSVFSGVDWFPTISSITGIPMPDIKPDGEDASDILTGTARPRNKPIMWEWRFNVFGVNPQQPPQLAIRDGKWKLFINPDGSGVELYDIPADPEERNNLAGANPAVVQRLKSALLDWKKTLP